MTPGLASKSSQGTMLLMPKVTNMTPSMVSQKFSANSSAWRGNREATKLASVELAGGDPKDSQTETPTRRRFRPGIKLATKKEEEAGMDSLESSRNLKYNTPTIGTLGIASSSNGKLRNLGGSIVTRQEHGEAPKSHRQSKKNDRSQNIALATNFHRNQ